MFLLMLCIYKRLCTQQDVQPIIRLQYGNTSNQAPTQSCSPCLNGLANREMQFHLFQTPLISRFMRFTFAPFS